MAADEATEDDVEIETRAVAALNEEAKARVTERPLAKLKSLHSDRSRCGRCCGTGPTTPTDAQKARARGRGRRPRGRWIVVDSMTGVSRPLLDEDRDVSAKRVPASAVLPRDVDGDEALVKAQGRRMQVEHRERGEVEMADDLRLVHKPVWLVELAGGDVVVVDATNGRVVSDVVLGRNLLPAPPPPPSPPTPPGHSFDPFRDEYRDPSARPSPWLPPWLVAGEASVALVRVLSRGRDATDSVYPSTRLASMYFQSYSTPSPGPSGTDTVPSASTSSSSSW